MQDVYLHLIQIVKQCQPEMRKNKTFEWNISELSNKATQMQPNENISL